MTASCGIEGNPVIASKPPLDDAIAQLSDKPAFKLFLRRPQAEASITAGRDIHRQIAITNASPSDWLPLDLVRRNTGLTRSAEEIQADCVALVRKELLVSFADSAAWKTLATIDSPSTLKVMKDRIAGVGHTST